MNFFAKIFILDQNKMYVLVNGKHHMVKKNAAGKWVYMKDGKQVVTTKKVMKRKARKSKRKARKSKRKARKSKRKSRKRKSRKSKRKARKSKRKARKSQGKKKDELETKPRRRRSVKKQVAASLKQEGLKQVAAGKKGKKKYKGKHFQAKGKHTKFVSTSSAESE
jgi:hypothetical protein